MGLIRAATGTVLKKSTAPATQLPPALVQSAPAGSLCSLVASNRTFDSHYLCSPTTNYSTGYGSVCELGRCFAVDAHAANLSRHRFNDSRCRGSQGAQPCAPVLASDEWLARISDWSQEQLHPMDILAKVPTVLQKVCVTAGTPALPPSQVLAVKAGYLCKLRTNRTFAGFWLCSHRGSGPAKGGVP